MERSADTQSAALLSLPINEVHRGEAHLHAEQHRRGATLCDPDFLSAVLTIANAALGTGLLGLPLAFRSAGVLGGTLITCALVVACAASLYIIMIRMGWAQAVDRDVKGFGALVRWGAGARTSWFVEVLVFVNCVGACIGYLVVLGDMLTPLLYGLLSRVAPSLPESSARVVVVTGSAIPCLLLSLLRRISALRYMAGVAIFACFFTTGLLVVQAIQQPCRPGDCLDGHGRRGWCTPAEARTDPSACSSADPTAGVSLWPRDVSSAISALPLILNALQVCDLPPSPITSLRACI